MLADNGHCNYAREHGRNDLERALNVANLKVAFTVGLGGFEGAGARHKFGNLEATQVVEGKRGVGVGFLVFLDSRFWSPMVSLTAGSLLEEGP